MTRLTHVGAVMLLGFGLIAAGPCGSSQLTEPVTTLHFAANGNFDSAGNYAPGKFGFNMADTASRAVDDSLPAGVRAEVWVGTCHGADATFQSFINGFAGDAHLYGFYLMDEPTPATCPAANLAAESDYVHATLPGVRTFIIMMNESGINNPTYPDYTPANSHLDQVGLDPYPCRTDAAVQPCDYSIIQDAATAAIQVGWVLSQIVPVYQAFGGYVPGTYVLPTAAEATQILQTWGGITSSPPWDYAYSWGTQNHDTALSDAPADLQAVFSAHNGG